MKKNTLSEHKFMAGISPCAGGTRQPCLAAQRYVRSTDGTCTSSFHVNTYKNTHMDIYAYRAPITRLINNLQNSFRKQKKISRKPCGGTAVSLRSAPCASSPAAVLPLPLARSGCWLGCRRHRRTPRRCTQSVGAREGAALRREPCERLCVGGHGTSASEPARCARR